MGLDKDTSNIIVRANTNAYKYHNIVLPIKFKVI